MQKIRKTMLSAAQTSLKSLKSLLPLVVTKIVLKKTKDIQKKFDFL